MIGSKFGHFLDGPLTPILKRLRLNPNFVTVAGFLVTSAGAGVLAVDTVMGGAIILVGSAMDMLDGMIARAHGRVTDFGAFLDSVLDRLSDALIFIGLAWHLASVGDHTGAFLSLFSMIGAFLVSYARARAEGLGQECKSGIMERPERLILLLIGIFSGYITESLFLLLPLTYLTVIQRIIAVRNKMKTPSPVA